MSGHAKAAKMPRIRVLIGDEKDTYVALDTKRDRTCAAHFTTAEELRITGLTKDRAMRHGPAGRRMVLLAVMIKTARSRLARASRSEAVARTRQQIDNGRPQAVDTKFDLAVSAIKAAGGGKL